MLDADRDAVFLNTSEFAEQITLYPKGNVDLAEDITAVVNNDKLIGTNEVDGDGVTPESKSGSRIRETMHLHISATITIDDRDRFLVQGKNVGLRRVLSNDGHMQVLLVDYVSAIATKTTRTAF